MKFNKVLALLLMIVLTLSTFSACSGKKEKQVDTQQRSTESKDSKKVESKSKESEQSSTDDSISFPIKDKNITLSYWVPMHGSATQLIKSYAENDVYKELEKITGIKIDFLHPAEGQASEQFNLMLVSDDLPDIIQYGFGSYPGGVEKALDDGIILRLNDLIDKHAPNYNLARNNDQNLSNWDVDEIHEFGPWTGWDKATTTNQGDIWAFTQIELVAEPSWWGPIIRSDLLDENKVEMPETIDEWYDVLTKFKKNGIEYPLLYPSNGMDWGGSFISAFDIASSFYRVGKDVKYGPMEKGFKDYLQTMNKWFSEGLIDPDFATRDGKSLTSLITSGKAGAMVTSIATLEQCYKAKLEQNFDYKATPYPSNQKGTKVKYRQFDPSCPYHPAVITTSCKYPAEAVKWFDYAYTEEGANLFNYGLEGTCHEIKDGKKVFTDHMVNNADNQPFYSLSFVHKLANGPFLRSFRASNYTFILDKSLYNARMTWAKSGTADYGLPYLTFTNEDSKRYSELMSDINTYKDEMILKFIMGVEPLDNFDNYVDHLKELNIEEAIKIKQDGLNIYNNK